MTYDGDWRETFRPDIPSVARIYDFPGTAVIGRDMLEPDSILADPRCAS